MCRSEIERPHAEGDHIVPYDGLNTTLDNLQALCTACNRKKGNRSMREMLASGWALPEEWGKPRVIAGDERLRDWQVEALQVALAAPDETLIEACPGAGKTRFAQEYAYELLNRGEITRVLAVVPTARLVVEWTEAARRGLRGSPTLPFAPSDWRPHSPIYEDWVGAVCTYATLFMNTTMMAALAAEPGHRTLVIFDEVHHAGIESAWGISAQDAFRSAAHRIVSLSGTPFRTKDPIVFVALDATGASMPDFRYGYGEALEDGACRPIQFVVFGGSARFESPDGEQHDVTFSDDLTSVGEGYRLRTVLEPDGGFLPEMLRHADAELRRLRVTDGDAGGLIIAMDCDHAERIAQLMSFITGVRPPVACTRTEDPNDANSVGVIEDFAAGTDPWLVSVRMVSEGVDIPRLRVLAYATNVRAELSFRQIIGRVVRSDDANEDDDFGVVLVPADPYLVEHVQNITGDAATRLPKPIVIDVDPEAPRRTIRISEDNPEGGEFKALGSTAEVSVVTDTSGRRVPGGLYAAAEAWLDRSADTSINAFELAWLAASDGGLAELLSSQDG